MIKIIFEAIFHIQVKVQICLYYMAFGYSFQFFQKIWGPASGYEKHLVG